MTARKRPAHWCAPETVILVRALYKLGVKRKVIRALTGVSDTGITHFVTRSERHRTQVKVAEPGTQDLFYAANKLATFFANKRDARYGSRHELHRGDDLSHERT